MLRSSHRHPVGDAASRSRAPWMRLKVLNYARDQNWLSPVVTDQTGHTGSQCDWAERGHSQCISSCGYNKPYSLSSFHKVDSQGAGKLIA